MKKIIFCLTGLLMAATNAGAVSVDCVAGALAQKISNADGVTELTLTGSINAADFSFINTSMPALRSLDLSAVTIAAYNGKMINGQTSFEADMIPAGALAGSGIASLKLPASPNLVIGDMAFAGTALTSVDIPATVSRLGYGVFADCSKLTTATVGDPGEYTFSGCKALAEVTLSGTTTIAEGTFKDCAALTSVAGADAVTAIGACAFQGCRALSNFTFGTGLTSIGAHAFSAAGLTEVLAGDCNRLSTLGAWAFENCTNLTKVVLPAGLHSAGEGVFAHCPALTTLYTSLEDIPDYAYKGAALPEMMLPAGTVTIGNYALMDVKTEELVLPQSLRSLGDGAMENATSLQRIDAGPLTEVPELGNEVWSGVEQATVKLETTPDMESAFRSTPQWMEFNVTGTSTIAEPVHADQPRVSVRFVDNTLQIRSHTLEMTGVEVYGIGGELLLGRSLSGTVADVDLGSIAGSVLIVRVNFEQQQSTVLKLARD